MSRTKRSSAPRIPAEWEPHEATWLAFPHHRTDFPGKLAAVPWTFAEMARVISERERVRVMCRDERERDRARKLFERAGVAMSQTDWIVQDTDRSWVRDSLPLWVREGKRSVAVKFAFDGWSRYRDHRRDDAAGRFVARKHADEARFPSLGGSPLVLEGGSIDVDGKGTLLTTEECLLSSKRARFRAYGGTVEARRRIAEEALSQWLGIRRVVWLPSGVAGDDTSGHVDDFARFAPKGKVLICDEPRRKDENHAPLRRAQQILQESTAADGKLLEMVKLPMPAPVLYDGQRLPASYANFYICNAATLVPTFNDPRDRDALAIIAECFPDRPVVGIHARDLVLGLGTLHCSTMQQPK